MPKAILELEMPESCWQCPCIQDRTETYRWCGAVGGDCPNPPYEKRRDDCPLKPVELLEQEIDRLKQKLDAVLQDFYQYVQGGKEICAFCSHDYECEPGETICGATYKGFRWRGLSEGEDL